MESNPHIWISVLREQQNHLAAAVEPFSAGQLRSQSYHSWTIAEVLSHLGSQAEFFTGWLEAGLSGAEPGGQETMRLVWDAWEARTPEQQATDSILENERLVQRFESLNQEELDRFHLSFFGMELSSADLVRLRLSEFALHSWDIEVALNSSAVLPATAVDLLIDSLDQIASRGGKPQEKSFQIRVRTSEPGRDFVLTVQEKVLLESFEQQSVDGEVGIPSEAFIRLLYGRMDANHTPEVRVTGHVTLGDLRSVFPGI